jgi:hypothetical protein
VLASPPKRSVSYAKEGGYDGDAVHGKEAVT